MAKKTIAELVDLAGKKVLVRVDFNVPLDESGNITNDRRIVGALPTLRALLDRGAALIVMSHLGQPEGDPAAPDFRQKNARLTMDRVAVRLRERLGRPVVKVNEVVGPEVSAAAAKLQPGDGAVAGEPAVPRWREGQGRDWLRRPGARGPWRTRSTSTTPSARATARTLRWWRCRKR